MSTYTWLADLLRALFGALIYAACRLLASKIRSKPMTAHAAGQVLEPLRYLRDQLRTVGVGMTLPCAWSMQGTSGMDGFGSFSWDPCRWHC